MTYFGFLGIFVVIPILLLWGIAIWDRRRGVALPRQWGAWDTRLIVLAHVFIAVIYTTPWDNYLVATRVWWYNPQLVTGVVLWYVPLEEYCFFVLQTLLTGAWLLMLARHWQHRTIAYTPSRARTIRLSLTAIVTVAWIGFTAMLIIGWKPGTYLGLLMAWALPPVIIQTWFGGDLLWKNRRIIAASIIPMTAYLAAADKLAISSGTWTIDPAQSLQSLGWIILGKLPWEELLFFFMTNTLITLGITLVSSAEAQQRAKALWAMLRQGRGHSAEQASDHAAVSSERAHL